MGVAAETEAMVSITEAFVHLDDHQIRRVLAWATDFYGERSGIPAADAPPRRELNCTAAITTTRAQPNQTGVYTSGYSSGKKFGRIVRV
jgi:hypothetical protein